MVYYMLKEVNLSFYNGNLLFVSWETLLRKLLAVIANKINRVT